MTGQQLITNLQYRLEDDTLDTDFPVTHKLNALNNALKSIISLVDDSYLQELMEIENSVSTASHSDTGLRTVVFSDLSGVPIRKGIIKVYDNTNNRFVSFKRFEDFDVSSDYKYGTVATVMGSEILISPTTCLSVDVWYLKEPSDIANDTTECPIDEILEPLLLDFAEAELWRADNRINRASTAVGNATQHLQILNAR